MRSGLGALMSWRDSSRGHAFYPTMSPGDPGLLAEDRRQPPTRTFGGGSLAAVRSLHFQPRPRPAWDPQRGPCLLEPRHAAADRGGRAPARGRDRAGRPARGPHRPPHRPLGQRQVHRHGAVGSDANIWWGKQQADEPGALRRACTTACWPISQGRELFVQDLLRRRRPAAPPAACASSPRPPGTACSSATCSSSRTADELRGLRAGVHDHRSCPSFQADPEIDGTRSEAVIAGQLRQEASSLIGGTSYAGEIKKSVFTILNYLLPAQGRACRCTARPTSARDGDAAIFFGLSGTGKTTLSADPHAHADRRRRAWLVATTASSTSRAAATPR